MGERVQDVVIGGGAIGVCCAEALASAGRDVVLIEKGTICSGCSHGNAGWVTPCHSLPIPGPGPVAHNLKVDASRRFAVIHQTVAASITVDVVMEVLPSL